MPISASLSGIYAIRRALRPNILIEKETNEVSYGLLLNSWPGLIGDGNLLF
jgi:hypothetical protein